MTTKIRQDNLEKRLAEQRGLVRDLTTVLEKRNAEIERLQTIIRDREGEIAFLKSCLSG